MKIRKKEDGNLSIISNLDKKQFEKILKTTKKLLKEAEYKSDVEKLEHTFCINTINMPTIKCKGFVCRTEDMKELISLDMDVIRLDLCIADIEQIIHRHNLSPFYLFTTDEAIDKDTKEVYGNYLAISLQKHFFAEANQIKLETHTDVATVIVARDYKHKSACIRISCKGNRPRPSFKCIVGDVNKSYKQEISSPHLKMLEQLYPTLPKIKYLNKDKCKRLELCTYLTGNVGGVKNGK